MKYVGRQSDPKDVSSLNPSAATDTVLDGSESIGGWKGGFIRTTVAKICAWIIGQANTWTATQTFANITARGYVAVQTETYPTSGSGLELSGPRGSDGPLIQSYDRDAGAFLPTRYIASAHRFTGVVEAYSGEKLGELSPTIKVKVITGTVSSTAGNTDIAHGLPNAASIIGVMPAVTLATGKVWLPNSTTPTWYFVNYDDSYVSVRTLAGSSDSVLNRPFKATIFYTA
ncbi:MAG: hypothetical protein LBE61_09795 [Burkholderiaceae bacterium]|jgi:hypothetical protein|nr:hypothetical protein [Burkholderiaceae bacterium]